MFATVINTGRCSGAGVGIRNGKWIHLENTVLHSAGVMKIYQETRR